MNYKPNEGDGRSIVSSSESSDRDDQLTEIIQQQRREITDLRATVEKLVKTVEAQSEQISTLEDAHTDYRETNERDKAEIRQDVTETKRATEQNEAHTEAVARRLERCDGSEERTPLEQIVRLPDEILHRAQLTANQRRARAQTQVEAVSAASCLLEAVVPFCEARSTEELPVLLKLLVSPAHEN